MYIEERERKRQIKFGGGEIEMPQVVPGSLQGCEANGFGQTYCPPYFITEWFIVLHMELKIDVKVNIFIIFSLH